MMKNDATVVVDGLRVVRGGREILHGLTFSLRPGELTGLLGPSGCGKSTLLRALVGVQQHVTGHIEVLGVRPGDPSLRKRIGYLTQAPSVYTDLTVRENLRFFASVLGLPRTDVDRVIGEVDLGDHADAVVSRLSGGQLSRASLAVALLGTPDLLVLDEPTVELDPVLRRDLWRLFRQVADRGTTVLVSSHVMDEAERCERLLLLREGDLLADETPDGLRTSTGAGNVEGAFLDLVDRAAEGAVR